VGVKAILVLPDGTIRVEDVPAAAETVVVMHEGAYVSLRRNRLARSVGGGTEIAVAFGVPHCVLSAETQARLYEMQDAGLWLKVTPIRMGGAP
jgi:hypothetical protein